MVFNGGKNGQVSPPSGHSACGSRLCRLLGFVLLVVVGVLLYTCMTQMSRNEDLLDRLSRYGREVTKLRSQKEIDNKRMFQLGSEKHRCSQELTAQSSQFSNRIAEADNFKKEANEFRQKLDTMTVDLKTKEDAFVQMESSYKKQLADREGNSRRMRVSDAAARGECDKRIASDLSRVIRILRAKYGAEPVAELSKAGIDVARIMQLTGASQSVNSDQVQRSGQGQPIPGQGQPNPGQDQPMLGQGQWQRNPFQEQRRPGQLPPDAGGLELPKTTKLPSKPGQEQPSPDQGRPAQGQEQPKPGQGQEQPKPGQGQEQPKLGQGQEQPKPGQGQEQPKPGQGQEQPKPGQGQEQPKPGQGQEQPKPGQGREQPKPGQEQPKPGQGQEQPKPGQGQEQPKPGQGQEQPKPGQQPPVPGQGLSSQLMFKTAQKIKEEEEQKQKASKGEANKDARQTPKPGQEQSKANQTKADEKDKAKSEDAKTAKGGSENLSKDDQQKTKTEQEKIKAGQTKENDEAKSKKEDAKPGQKTPEANKTADKSIVTGDEEEE